MHFTKSSLQLFYIVRVQLQELTLWAARLSFMQGSRKFQLFVVVDYTMVISAINGNRFEFKLSGSRRYSSHCSMSQRPRGGTEVQLYSFFNLGARWGGWSMSRPGRFTPGKDPVPIAQEAGLVPGPVWTGTENLALRWDLIPGPSSPQGVGVLTELYQPTLSGSAVQVYVYSIGKQLKMCSGQKLYISMQFM